MKGSALFQGEIITKLRKYIDKFKKKSSPQLEEQFQQNFTQIIFGWREFKFAEMKGLALFKGEIITKLRKYIDKF